MLKCLIDENPPVLCRHTLEFSLRDGVGGGGCALGNKLTLVFEKCHCFLHVFPPFRNGLYPAAEAPVIIISKKKNSATVLLFLLRK